MVQDSWEAKIALPQSVNVSILDVIALLVGVEAVVGRLAFVDCGY